MSGAIKLLTVSNFFDSHRGGLEIVAGRLARELSVRGFEVTWLASDTTPAPADAGLRCVAARVWNVAERRLGVPWPVLSPGSIARLWREVKAADAVLLHDALYMASVVTFLAAKAHRRPLVIVQHIGQIPYRSPVLRGLMALANRLVAAPVLSGADQVVFISEFVRTYFGRLRFRLAAAPRLQRRRHRGLPARLRRRARRGARPLRARRSGRALRRPLRREEGRRDPPPRGGGPAGRDLRASPAGG